MARINFEVSGLYFIDKGKIIQEHDKRTDPRCSSSYPARKLYWPAVLLRMGCGCVTHLYCTKPVGKSTGLLPTGCSSWSWPCPPQLSK